MVSNTTSAIKKAAQEMTQTDRKINDIKDEIVTEGAYNVIVEGGYHNQKLTDKEVDILTTLLVDHGVLGLITLANDTYTNERRNVAQIKPLINIDESSFEKVINRLDDGNTYHPGFKIEFDKYMNVYTLYEEL